MKIRSYYKFTSRDIRQVMKFCRDYHLEITKQSMGRTGSGPRGLGGEIDAFGPGKLNEIAVSKLLSTKRKKSCLVDNKIYSNYEVGMKTIPDIVGVRVNSRVRKPNIYVEVKKISESDQWLGVHIEQLNSILRDSTIKPNEIFLVFGEVYFADNNNKKQQDFLGAFLRSVLDDSSLSFRAFSQISSLRCNIRYVISIAQLQEFGHEFVSGDIIPELDFRSAKGVFRTDGSLRKGLKVKSKLKGHGQLVALGLDGNKYKYGIFEADGFAHTIKKENSSRQYLYIAKETRISNEYFGEIALKRGQVISFNVRNKLSGLQGSQLKTKSDLWISRKKIDQLIRTGEIAESGKMLNELSKII